MITEKLSPELIKIEHEIMRRFINIIVNTPERMYSYEEIQDHRRIKQLARETMKELESEK